MTEFIDEALGDGCRIVLLAGTGSAPEDSVLSSAMLNLGPARWALSCVQGYRGPSAVLLPVSH